MAYSTLSVTAPTGTTYDSENPTQGTEELNMTLHAILQDMEDAGAWLLTDERPDATQRTAFLSDVFSMVDEVFDYAEGAISTYRDTGTATLAAPTSSTINPPGTNVYPELTKQAYQVWVSCTKIVFLIYYMWKTETDPLRVKDFIRDMLLAWPLQDVAINLKDEGGSELKVFPAWNNLDA